MRERRQQKLLVFLILSCFFHALLLLLIAQRPEATQEPEIAALNIELLTRPKQIADIQKPKEQKRPEKADFIGVYDSTVKEEQVAVSPPQPGAPQPQRAIERPERPEQPRETPKASEDLAALFAKKHERAQRRSEEAEQAPKKYGQLPEDFYPDYKIGPHTYLNVLRFPDVQYFVRLKRIFKMTFNPAPVLRHYLFSNQVTRGHVEVVLGVVVEPSGTMGRLFVIRSSGLEHYDNEALRTVRDSSPFAKPPSVILGPDGRLRMSWTFTVYM